MYECMLRNYNCEIHKWQYICMHDYMYMGWFKGMTWLDLSLPSVVILWWWWCKLGLGLSILIPVWIIGNELGDIQYIQKFVDKLMWCDINVSIKTLDLRVALNSRGSRVRVRMWMRCGIDYLMMQKLHHVSGFIFTPSTESAHFLNFTENLQ